MYKILIDGLQTKFRNEKEFLKIFLTIPVSNESGECSFSVLKRVKNYHRNRLTQTLELPNSFIENDVVW
jgi:hypothetical protein